MLDELVQWLQDDEPKPGNFFAEWPRRTTEWLIAIGVVFADGYLTSIVCAACHHGHRASLKPSPRGQRYYCPRTGWIYPTTRETIAYRIDMLEVAKNLAASLDLPTDRVRTKSDGRLFLIGDASFGGMMRTLFVARKAETARQLTELARLVDAAGSKNTGFVLCAGDAPSAVRTKHRHQFFPLGEALGLQRSKVCLDRGQLEWWAGDLDRSRAREGSAATTPADWKYEAGLAWERLHKSRVLTRNATEMGRLVRADMLKAGCSEADVPQAKAISDELRKLHRRSFPRRRKRTWRG